MSAIRRLIWVNLKRRPGRTVLTLGGVAAALFLFVAVESLSEGLGDALDTGAAARTLIVYRQNRYCPQTSFLPERYVAEIEKVPGVVGVLPVKVFLNNCRASLDLVTFQGAPIDRLFDARDLTITDGDVARFRRQGDAALLGRAFAQRRGLVPGQKFRLGDVTVDVAGIFASADPVEENVILTHLEFLQRAGPVNRLGTVTQFEVRIDDPAHADAVASAIDSRFKTAEEPTDTRPRSEFLADATDDLRELLRFGRLFGLVCVLVVLVLVANTVLMAIQERAREFGVLLTIGYPGRDLLLMVLGETFALTLVGASIGIAAAAAVVHWSGVAIGVEGVSVTFSMSPAVIAKGLAVALLTGALAGLFPALRAARADAVVALRGG